MKTSHHVWQASCESTALMWWHLKKRTCCPRLMMFSWLMPASEHRAILTFNVGDFAILHEQYMTEGKEHWGIILSNREPIGELLRRILRLLNSASADELRNQIRWLNEFK